MRFFSWIRKRILPDRSQDQDKRTRIRKTELIPLIYLPLVSLLSVLNIRREILPNNDSIIDIKINIIDKEYDGYVFDKINRNDGLFQYIVFLPELKLSSRITLRDDF